MKIRKLSDVFTAVNKDTTQLQQPTQVEDPLVQKTARDAEAVRVAADFGSGVESSTERAERVAKLKEQVAKGEYNPDSTAVAEAFIKDLLI